MSTIRKVIEIPRGIGKVYKEGNEFAKVEYRIELIQEYAESITSEGRGTIPTLKEIRGLFRLIEGNYLPLGDTSLTLYLEDGRKWNFFISESSEPGIYSAANPPGGAADF